VIPLRPPAALLCIFVCVVANAAAQSIAGWRTNGTGKYPATAPPTEWSTTKNVVWATSMPDWSNSSPIVKAGHVFVCAEPFTLVCVRASDGQILWQRTHAYTEVLDPAELAKMQESAQQLEALDKEIASLRQEALNARRALRKAPDDKQLGRQVEKLTDQLSRLNQRRSAAAARQLPPTHPENGYSSCTPTTNGRSVCALFGNGVAACYDMAGNRKWIKLIERPTDGNGLSASPVLAGDKLIVLINRLIALDVETGEVLWRAPAQPRYGSPVRAHIANADLIVTPGGEIVRADDGKVLASGLSNLEYCAPIVDKDVAYFIQAGGKAVNLAGSIRPETLWQTNPISDRYYASPAVHDGLIYAVTQAGEFSVIDAKTGAVLRRKKLELGPNSTVYSSVTLAGNFLYVTGENGATVVMEAGRDTREIARNQLDRLRSSPVFVGNYMYIRTRDKLYCIGTR
jgi:outer membrane protein assembly factor BamB